MMVLLFCLSEDDWEVDFKVLLLFKFLIFWVIVDFDFIVWEGVCFFVDVVWYFVIIIVINVVKNKYDEIFIIIVIFF